MLFVFLSTLSIPLPAADSDCTGDNCVNDGNYWTKIKRLSDMDMPDWGGEEVISGDTSTSSDKQFCTIAYLEGNPRAMYNVITSIDGTSSDNAYTLKLEGRRPSIPVAFKITSVDGKAPQTGGTYQLGDKVTLTGDNRFDQCKDNELILTATVSRDDILATGTTGTYTGNFSFYSRSAENRPLGRASMSFTVTLEVLPVIQISGLKDIMLSVNRNIARGSHQFCVFAMGKSRFRLEASSQVGTDRPRGRFNLKNGENYIEYDLTVSDSNNTQRKYNRNRARAGFKPSTSYLCNAHTAPNITVDITTEPVTGAEAGVYSDTMTFTVSPY